MRPMALNPLFASAQTLTGIGPRLLSLLKKAVRLPPGVAYVDFNGFPGNQATNAAVTRFLETHKDAKTLIIDARQLSTRSSAIF